MRAKPGGEASDGTGEHVGEGEGQEHVLRKRHDEVDDQTEDNDEECRPGKPLNPVPSRLGVPASGLLRFAIYTEPIRPAILSK